DQGFQFEVAISNAILGGLVSGFETYCKYRFLELEGEGVNFDVKGLVDVARFKKVEKEGVIKEFLASDTLQRRGLLHRIIEVERRVNFQNFSDAKRAFKRSFGVDFNSLGFTETQL